VIGNKPWIDSLNRQEGKFLLKFQSEYRDVTRKRNAPAECRWYKPGQVDVSQEADAEGELLDQTQAGDEPDTHTEIVNWEQQPEEPQPQEPIQPTNVTTPEIIVVRVPPVDTEPQTADIILEEVDTEPDWTSGAPKETSANDR
jgi:hypothetical protein